VDDGNKVVKDGHACVQHVCECVPDALILLKTATSVSNTTARVSNTCSGVLKTAPRRSYPTTQSRVTPLDYDASTAGTSDFLKFHLVACNRRPTAFQ